MCHAHTNLSFPLIRYVVCQVTFPHYHLSAEKYWNRNKEIGKHGNIGCMNGLSKGRELPITIKKNTEKSSKCAV